MTTNNVTTPCPARRGLEKVLILCFVLLLGLFSSCGDDDDNTEIEMRNAVIGTWEEEAVTDSIFKYAKCVIVFGADGTMNGYTKFPEDFRDTYEGNMDKSHIDDDGYMTRAQGRWNVSGNTYHYYVDKGYSYKSFGDWQWHDVGYETTFSIDKGVLYLYHTDGSGVKYYQKYHKINDN